jgi:redox-sensing transcriptional repressor
VGYDAAYLLYQIQRELGLTQDWPVVIVGVGNLGHALANYGGFATRGFRVVGLIDADPDRVGERVAVGRDGQMLDIAALTDLEKIVTESDALIGVIATPAAAAQDVCDRLVDCGVTSILNFAPVVLATPSSVHVRKVDLATELQILAFHEQRRGDAHEVIV